DRRPGDSYRARARARVGGGPRAPGAAAAAADPLRDHARALARPDLPGMAGGAGLSEAFEALRPRLVRQAYAVLGSVGDAEDVVQEAWLRLQRTRAPIRELEAWLVTVVG